MSYPDFAPYARELPNGKKYVETMHPVPYELHKDVKHSGGAAVYKHGSGVPRYGN